MKKLLGILLSAALLLSVGSVVRAGGEEPQDDYTAPTIEKPVYITVTDDLGNPVSGATVQVMDADKNDVGTYVSSENGSISIFLEKGTYTLKVTDAPAGYIFTGEPQTISVTLTEAEEKDDIRADTIPSTDPAHKLFCKHNPSHLENYKVYDEGEGVTGYCFNQNYDPPALENDDCLYKRLVGSPEQLYDLAQCK